MKYQNVVEATFLSRPNRFVAMCQVFDQVYRCHVKNTGRCKELLIPGATVYLVDRRGMGGSTDFSLIAVQKGDRLINMESQAPNAVVGEALRSGALTLPGFEEPDVVRGEYPFGQSRLDFFVQKEEKTALIEVKGVTLEREGAVYFPDAPTLRGIKHLQELEHAKDCERFVLFVIQMENAHHFSPNDETHREFGDALRSAVKSGVHALAFTCKVTPDTLSLDQAVPIIL